ncbi:hypothetical protein GIB67_029401 [Kingdonia uniflora]|uniref:Dof zinc finger protein n=1 Tax=Kingdonia uniflora TaxID=39325 RepID=A0A7J7NY27_9MAGN|nr:hypothetical protein GIB67_029401 [Kingdonia uniflora]
MVFPSVPVYLDPPNWQQQTIHQPGTTSNENPHHPPLSPPATPANGGTNSSRPNSMADLARMAKIPQPEVALKCPRCDSSNTKFCYYNNYNLSQPRHFCKTCRRYWTRGGALRNVPVGGGCRRNKITKSSKLKSPVINSEHQTGSGSISSAVPSSSCTRTEIVSRIGYHLPLQLSCMPSLHHLSDYGAPDTALNFGGSQAQMGRTDMGFQMGINSSSGGGLSTILSGEQWQTQRFPFLGGLETPQGLYPYISQGVADPHTNLQLRPKPQPDSSAEMHDQVNSIKMEENQRFNLSRQFLSIPGNDQFLGSNAWTDLSGFTSSSTTHLL